MDFPLINVFDDWNDSAFVTSPLRRRPLILNAFRLHFKLRVQIFLIEQVPDCCMYLGIAATGMNAATTMLLALVPAGGHIITTTDCYRRTRQFIQTVLPKMGISATVIDPADMEVEF